MCLLLSPQQSPGLHLVAVHAKGMSEVGPECFSLLQQGAQALYFVHVGAKTECFDGFYQRPACAQFQAHEKKIGAEKRVRFRDLPAHALYAGTGRQTSLAADQQQIEKRGESKDTLLMQGLVTAAQVKCR